MVMVRGELFEKKFSPLTPFKNFWNRVREKYHIVVGADSISARPYLSSIRGRENPSPTEKYYYSFVGGDLPDAPLLVIK